MYTRKVPPAVSYTHLDVYKRQGYIGRTGLATGCHVCFRFWKNRKQVDHLREKMPPPQAMDPKQLPEYFKVRNQIKAMLDGASTEKVPAPTTNSFDLFTS